MRQLVQQPAASRLAVRSAAGPSHHQPTFEPQPQRMCTPTASPVAGCSASSPRVFCVHLRHRLLHLGVPRLALRVRLLQHIAVAAARHAHLLHLLGDCLHRGRRCCCWGRGRGGSCTAAREAARSSSVLSAGWQEAELANCCHSNQESESHGA